MNKYKVYYMIPGVKGTQTDYIEARSKKAAHRDFYDKHLDKEWVNIKKINYVKEPVFTWKLGVLSVVQGAIIGLGLNLANINVSAAEGVGLVFLIAIYGSLNRMYKDYL